MADRQAVTTRPEYREVEFRCVCKCPCHPVMCAARFDTDKGDCDNDCRTSVGPCDPFVLSEAELRELWGK